MRLIPGAFADVDVCGASHVLDIYWSLLGGGVTMSAAGLGLGAATVQDM